MPNRDFVFRITGDKPPNITTLHPYLNTGGLCAVGVFGRPRIQKDARARDTLRARPDSNRITSEAWGVRLLLHHIELDIGAPYAWGRGNTEYRLTPHRRIKPREK